MFFSLSARQLAMMTGNISSEGGKNERGQIQEKNHKAGHTLFRSTVSTVALRRETQNSVARQRFLLQALERNAALLTFGMCCAESQKLLVMSTAEMGVGSTPTPTPRLREVAAK